MSWGFGISTGACIDCPILQVLPALFAAGTTAVEISTPPGHFNPWRHDEVAALQRALAGGPLAAVSIHAPFGGLIDLAALDPEHRQAGIDAVLVAAAALKALGGRVVVVHPSDVHRNAHDLDARLRASASSVRTLAARCRQEGMTLALETPLPHLVGGHPDEFAAILAGVDDTVGVCLDTGHTWLGHHWTRFAALADGRLVHVHAHDNQGSWDDHLPPGEGKIDWAVVATTLRALRFRGLVVLELRCVPGDLAPYFRHAQGAAQALLPPDAG